MSHLGKKYITRVQFKILTIIINGKGASQAPF